jgi:hypothetical protein
LQYSCKDNACIQMGPPIYILVLMQMIINMYIFAIEFDYYEENLSSTISDIMYMYMYTYIGLCTCCKYKVVAMFV